jgi:uncharacterized membrane protein
MKLNAPKKIIFLICVLVFIVGIVSNFISIPYASEYKFWLVSGSFVLLALANILKGL